MTNRRLNLRLQRFRLKALRRLRGFLGLADSRDMARFVSFYREIWSEAAAAVGADFEDIGTDLWQISLNGKKTLIHNFRTPIDNPIVLHLAGDKALAYKMLAAKGLTIPPYRAFNYRHLQSPLEFMAAHPGGCFVVKPAWGTSGSAGVTTHIRTTRQCIAAVALSSIYHDQVLIERQIFGETYRILVLDGKPLHVVKRKGLIVVGNGHSTIHELAQAQLTDPLGDARHVPLDDRDLNAEITCQGLSTTSVPDRGRKVVIRTQLSNRLLPTELRTVFTDDATTDVAPAVIDQAVRAAAALHVTFAGVDLVIVDPALPLEQSNGAIIEVNTTPGLHHHYHQGQCLGRSPTVAVVEYLLEHTPF